MSDERSENRGSLCELDAEGHCITCSDEAMPVRVLRIDAESGLALVEVKDTTEEIDVTLVEEVVPGDVLLVHGGVAIGHLGVQGATGGHKGSPPTSTPLPPLRETSDK